MDSVTSQPAIPFNVDLKIFSVECQPNEVLVKFQGKFSSEFEFDYHILQNEIQNVPKVKDHIGIGHFCLVEEKDSMEWHRGRILTYKGDIAEVLLIDTGNIVKVSANQVASACGELFQLPPKIVCGIFSNILPVEEKWTPKAINYFSSLIGMNVKGHVQKSLPSQVVVLAVQKVINNVLELRLAKYVDCDTFNFIVEMVEKFPLEPFYKQMPDLLQQKPTLNEPSQKLSNFEQVVDHLRPCLSVGTAEKVKITAAESPSKFYCQMLSWVQELEKLTSAMCLHYEAINGDTCDHFGLLCAAKRHDGQWYRGVLRQLLPDDKVKVWFMDFGYNEAVPSQFVHKLQTTFSLPPMMCVPCALSCLAKHNENHINAQLGQLRRALVGETVLVYIDLFSMEQRLYHVTLHPQDLPVPDTLKHENRLIPLFSPNAHSKTFTKVEEKEISDRKYTLFKNVVGLEPGADDTNRVCTKISCPVMEMKIDSVYVVYVQYVLNPSNFWVRNSEHETEYLTLMKHIEEKYATPEAFEKPLENPVPGLLCCARYSKDLHFYRAVVSEVDDLELTVYFLDFGNTETVSYCDVKPLFPEFCELPAIAMSCALGNAVSVDEVWTKSASDFFKKTVLAKPILLHVLGKQNEKYFVDLRHTDPAGESNVVSLMVQAGCAEYWKPIQAYSPQSQTKDSKVSVLKEGNMAKQTTLIQTNKVIASSDDQKDCVKKNHNAPREALCSIPNSKNIPSKQIVTVEPVSHYDHHMFKPGTIIEAICSHMCSPSDFWCQLNSKYAALESLMKRMQNHYDVHEEPYSAGQVACVARRLVDGKWYRGAIVDYVSKEEVIVMFVDYGFQERVKVVDLKGIIPDFLMLKGQAFRCSLYNLVEPINSDPINWSTNACADFRSFIDSATFGSLKCTIYALILFTPRHLCNVVNLETPFLSAKQFLINKGHAQTVEVSKPLMSPISLFSFMYSSFDVKIGSEEEICITHIYDPKKFFCQLSKNSHTIDALMTRVAQIGDRVIPSDDCPLRLCIAKYFEDGNFYRALVCPTQSSSLVMVYFVDFGNEQVVEKHELLPIPREATDILYTPMQALRCYLSDLKAHLLPLEVVKWFEENYLGKILKAVVVSKDMDGQLSLELYDGDVKINKKMKELVKKYANVCGDGLEKNPKLISNIKNVKVEEKKNMDYVKKISRENSTSFANDLSDCTQIREIFDKKQEIKVPVLHSVTHDTFQFSSMSNSEMSSDTSLDSDSNCLNFVRSAKKVTTKRKLHISQQENLSNVSPMYMSLPKPNLKPSSERLGYISHITSPSSFCIQLADDEHEIIQLAEELNSQCVNLLSFSKEHEFQIGDLVVTEYANDAALYRAIIKQVNSVELFGVEFIDYGNESVVRRSALYQLPGKFLSTPRLSIPAFLSETQGTSSEMISSPFLENLRNSAEPVNFKFVQEREHHWEVHVNCVTSIGVESWTCKGDSEPQKMLGNQSHVGRLDLNQNAIFEETKETVANEALCQPEKGIFDKANLPELKETVVHPIPNQSVASGQLQKAKLHNISDCGTFYVTLKESTTESINVSALVESAAQLEASTLPAESVKVGIMCLAKSEQILKWLRSEVKAIFHEEKKMLVFFVDLGKTEKVSMRNAKVLNENLKSIPRQTVACKWAWLEKAGKQTFLSVMSSLTHQVLKILFLQYLENDATWEVEILVGDLLLMQYLGLPSCPVKKSDSDSTVSLVPVYSVPWIKLQCLKPYPGFACAATDPANFFIQLEESFDCLMDLCFLLSDLPDSVPKLPSEQIIPGSHCLLKYDRTEQWCRAEVCKVSVDFVSLTLIDFGHCLEIPTVDIEKLKIIPEQIVCLPRLAYQCALSEVIPANLETWTEPAILYFKNYVHEKELLIKFSNYKQGIKLEVDISNEHRNLADDLVASGYAVRQVRKKSSLPVHTEFVDNPTKSFKMTWTKKSAKLDVTRGINETNLQQNFKDTLPHENKTAQCEHSVYIPPPLSTAQLGDETSMCNHRENSKNGNFSQKSKKEIVDGSVQVFTFHGLSKNDSASNRKNRTPKNGGSGQLKEIKCAD